MQSKPDEASVTRFEAEEESERDLETGCHSMWREQKGSENELALQEQRQRRGQQHARRASIRD